MWKKMFTWTQKFPNISVRTYNSLKISKSKDYNGHSMVEMGNNLHIYMCVEKGIKKTSSFSRKRQDFRPYCGNPQTPKVPDWQVFVPNPDVSGWPKYRPGILWSVGGRDFPELFVSPLLLYFPEILVSGLFEVLLYPELPLPDLTPKS